jgi:class 3 adenylate cyclase
MMTASPLHAFVSYVREDAHTVEALCSALKAGGVDVWLDREMIQPGERWQVAIRQAIERGAFFLACFSEASAKRDRSYMNFELTIAVDQLRYRPVDRAWFIPALLQGGTVPDRPIGGGETLRDIQWVDLASDWSTGVERLLKVMRGDEPSTRETSSEPGVPPQLRQATVVLATDVVGASALLHAIGEKQFLHVLGNFSSTANAIVSQLGGEIASFTGDGFIALFESAAGAIECAQRIRQFIAPFRTGLPTPSNVGVRFGLAAGAVLRTQGQVTGTAIIQAVRICSLAEPDETLVSEDVHRMTHSDEFRFGDRGRVALKGLAEGLRLFELQARHGHVG